jgi:hypothetical protein
LEDLNDGSFVVVPLQAKVSHCVEVFANLDFLSNI